MIICLCDGSSKGNPGPSSIAVVIWKRLTGTSSARRTTPTETIRQDIGVATNNEAEWCAVVTAAQYVRDNAKPSEDVFIYSDSLLVVNQANGEWKTKNDRMDKLLGLYQGAVSGIKVKLSWLPRQLTYLADKET